MRTYKFDKQDAEALCGMGFTISDDGEVAELTDELVKLSVVNSGTELWVAVVLPNYRELHFTIPHSDLHPAA
jgi:hypothetical protein